MNKNLDNYIEEFYIVKNDADKYKKLAEEDNKKIKEMMKESDTTEYVTPNGYIAKINVSNRESFIEDKLIEKLLELNQNDIVELVPTINYDKLEDAIYNGRIDASILSNYKETKQVTTLKVTIKKGE